MIYRKRKEFAHIDQSKGRYVSKAFDNAVLIIQWLNKAIKFFLTNNKSTMDKKEGYYDLFFNDPEISNPQPITKNDVEKIWDPIKDKLETTINFKDFPVLFKENGRKVLAAYRFLINNKYLLIKNINANNVTFEINKDTLNK